MLQEEDNKPEAAVDDEEDVVIRPRKAPVPQMQLPSSRCSTIPCWK